MTEEEMLEIAQEVVDALNTAWNGESDPEIISEEGEKACIGFYHGPEGNWITMTLDLA